MSIISLTISSAALLAAYSTDKALKISLQNLDTTLDLLEQTQQVNLQLTQQPKNVDLRNPQIEDSILDLQKAANELSQGLIDGEMTKLNEKKINGPSHSTCAYSHSSKLSSLCTQARRNYSDSGFASYPALPP